MAQLKDLLVNGSARVIGSLFANLSGNVLNFGVCSTAAATAAKTVTTNGTFELITGSKILVLFSETDSSNAPTLNVNGTGAKSIKINASDGIGKGFLVAQQYYWFVYDGTNWRTAGAGITQIIPTQYGGTGNSSYTANRVLYTNTATKFASSTITTDGAYLSNISYLSVNYAHQTSYRAYINGNSYFNGNANFNGNISFSNSGTGFRGINYGTMGDSDQWRIGGAATGGNQGYMEIATAGDATEPIYVRQYTGVFTTLKRTLTLLDANGNSNFPGTIYFASDKNFINQYDYTGNTKHNDNLILNGTCRFKNNTNFSNYSYTGSQRYNESYGSFYITSSGRRDIQCDEYIPVNPNLAYRLSLDVKSDNNAVRQYIYYDCYDIDKNYIHPHCVVHLGSYTTLARDLKNGDTVVYLTSAAEWNVNTGTADHQRGFIFWNWTDSTGYTYDYNTYSRNAWENLYTDANVNKTNNTITLSSAWNHGTFPAGTKVSQSQSSGHLYFVSNTQIPSTWTHYSTIIYGFSSSWDSRKFPHGTCYIRVGGLWNYTGASSGNTVYMTNWRLELLPDLSSAVGNLAKKLTIQANGVQKGQFNNSADVTVNLGNVAQDFTGANSGNAANINADTFAGMTRQQWLNTVYPVGSIYMSVSATSPATLFGGTWESLGGRFLIGQDGTYTAGSTGGSATHTHTIAHTHTMAHTHAQVATTSGGPSNNTSGGTAITVAQMPAHKHRVSYRQGVVAQGTSGMYYFDPGTSDTWIATPSMENTGSGQAHTHTLSSHTHTTAATTTGGASNAITSAASNETSGSTSTLPPYLAVYMWKRTA